MSEVVQFVKAIFILAIALGMAGTLVEATGFFEREAVKARHDLIY